MKNLHLILLLIAALWTAFPAESSFRALFDLSRQDPTSGDVWTQSDPPDTDPAVINMPPPR